MTTKKKYILVALLALLILTIVLSVVFRPSQKVGEDGTGGSGVAQRGHLILRGYEVQSNNSDKLPLGRFLDVDHQTNIRNYLEVILFNKKQLQEYEGSVVPGTFDIDYRMNIIRFNVEIKDPKSVYTVVFNSISNELYVLDEAGNRVEIDGS